MIKYKRMYKKDNDKVINLIDNVMSTLENKDFFMPFDEYELSHMYDEEFMLLYGAFDEDKLVAISGLYVSGDHLEEIKDIINLKDKKIAELRWILSFTRV